MVRDEWPTLGYLATLFKQYSIFGAVAGAFAFAAVAAVRYPGGVALFVAGGAAALFLRRPIILQGLSFRNPAVRRSAASGRSFVTWVNRLAVYTMILFLAIEVGKHGFEDISSISKMIFHVLPS